ncbi:MAG: TetR/AcrR family transcriptional regulator [Proteobacteria bacterium]|nr:TetR/AcrR family transcriptional regulator [Pseudomonadota bacterium]
MTNSDDRRAAILDKLADHMVAEGLAGSSLRPLAKAAGTSDRMLLYYFKDKAEIITATLETVAARLVTELTAQMAAEPMPFEALRDKLVGIVMAEEMVPFMTLWMEIAARAARRDPIYRAVGEQIARGFLAWGAAQLDCPSDEIRKREAARLLVTIEGMVFLKSVGLEDVCEDAS